MTKTRKLTICFISLLLFACKPVTYVGTVVSIQSCAGLRYAAQCAVTLDNGKTAVTDEMVAIGSRICNNARICRSGQ